jgi:hypothetical protein
VRAAAKQLERSEPTMWRVEAGLVSVRSVEVEIMCRLYGATDEMTKALMALAKETKAKGWWQTYGMWCRSGLTCSSGLRLRRRGCLSMSTR